MADNTQFAALEWVVDEIGETLHLAAQALEDYVENPVDGTKIRFCLTYLHQITGTLRMVELTSAVQLSEEMEKLAQALMENEVRNAQEAQNALMQAMLWLPNYLEQVQSKRVENASLLLSQINDMRAARDEELLSRDVPFKPNLEPAKQLTGKLIPLVKDGKKFVSAISKLRKMYQYTVIQVVRGVDEEDNLAYLIKVSERMLQMTSGTPRRSLWEITNAFVGGIQEGSIELTAAVKNLLRQIDGEIKLLAETGPRALRGYTSEKLLSNLLYYIAQAESERDDFTVLKEKYDLDAAMEPAAQIEVLAITDQDTVRSVVEALKTELDFVKQALEKTLEQNSEEIPASLKETLPVFKRVEDTMSVLGINSLCEKVADQAGILKDIVDGNDEPKQDVLLGVASQLLTVESTLEHLARGEKTVNVEDMGRALQLGDAQKVVIEQCRTGLEQAKDAVVEYIAAQWDEDHLANVPGLLEGIRGSLEMVPLARPASILGTCSKYVSERLLGATSAPEWEALDTLADAITSAEYYLECLCGAAENGDDALLEVAEESLAKLGYPVAGAPKANTTSETEESFEVDEPSTLETAEIIEIAAPIPEVIESESFEEDTAANVVEEQSDIGEESIEVESAEVADVSMEAVQETEAEDLELDEELDEEILEIFVEEAGEVLEAIDEFFPQWAEDFKNDDALNEFRRAFHTLKGSGRMVNANDIGELAWSVENMLNRIIDNSIKPGGDTIEFIKRVRSILPAMVSAFEARKVHPYQELASKLEAVGHGISNGETIEFPEEPDLSVEAEEQDVVADGEPLETTIEESAELAEESISEQFEEASTDEDDDEQAILWGIFSGEAKTHLALVGEFVEAMEEAKPLYEPPGEGMQRALHTLKGSAHMADVAPVAQLATPWEHFMKEMRSYLVPVDEDILQLIKDGAAYTELVLQQIEEGQPLEIPRLDQFLARCAELKEHTVGHLIRQKEAREEMKVDPKLLELFMAEEMSVLLDADDYIAEWRGELNNIDPLKKIHTELGVLGNGAAKAGQTEMASLASDLRAVHSNLIEHPGFEIDEPFICALEQGHNSLLDMIDAMAAGQNSPEIKEDVIALLHEAAVPEIFGVSEIVDLQLPVGSVEEEFAGVEKNIDSEISPENAQLDDASRIADELLEFEPVDEDVSALENQPNQGVDDSTVDVSFTTEAEELASRDEEYDEETVGIFLEEADELLEDIETVITEWEADAEATEPQEELKRTLHTFKGGARMAGIKPIGDLAHDFETYLIEQAGREDCLPKARDYQDKIFAAVEAVRAGKPVVQADIDAGTGSTIDETSVLEPVVGAPDVVSANDVSKLELPSDIDPEIMEIFLEEADELLEEIDESLNTWKGDLDSLEPGEELKRVLHTFKGGARLCGLVSLGDIAHNFETFLIDAHNQGRTADTLFDEMHNYHDQLLALQEKAKDAVAVEDSGALAELMKGSGDYEVDGIDNIAPVERGSKQEISADVLPFKPKQELAPTEFKGVGDVVPSAPQVDSPAAGPNLGGMQAQARRQGPQEVVKISAELLEELVNLAGETSIQRGRVEEQMSDFVFSLEEMETTIGRLQDQLRRLDMETQAQVQFREEQMMDQNIEFDPLEMDRYSQLQQLSRSLFEAASDLTDLKQTMEDKARDTETLLLQQSRVNTDLQEGLMRSRMVPFSRMVPRLRRIVRQTSNEVGKNVELLLENVEGEMDRSVLERMVPPLEHMLRNAIDHGLESPQERSDADKPDVGRILISMKREGGDIVLRIADDGRGINLEKVREKAIANGLMARDSILSDQEVMQFILHAGFSTADQVSQISGRGVGMDVVYSEIKQLGGNVSINSRWGEGTEFLVRLPFTVSVNRALMIEIGSDHYAVPLNTIEGIVRISPFELDHYYQNPTEKFEYAGEQYDLRYLGTLLHSTSRPKLESRSLPLPVVLVRSADYSVALQVDQLLGSREIVVKTLGTQFSAVHGLSGATVLGDGSVVVILDLLGLIRSESKLIGSHSNVVELRTAVLERPEEEDVIAASRVMVVDDSVTVRKVTGRFLEREGFEVITATDGRDAMTVLQDHTPDVMLLDIEMPRMDGFEVVAAMRSSPTLKHIPIIMITSRTGDKHRERALSLGANRYMGKPYQEDQLLATINELIEEKAKAES